MRLTKLISSSNGLQHCYDVHCSCVTLYIMLFLQVVPVDKPPVERSVKKTEVMQDIQKCKKLCCVCLFYIMFQFLSLV